MSTSSKCKSKDKKAVKEPSKASSKSLLHVTAGGGGGGDGVAASGYNPLLGTFHSIETASLSSPPQVNVRFRNIDDTDNHNNMEYDSISNNVSWSGESEDHKDKILNQSVGLETVVVVVPGGDNDKREKIRQKNEKKHQRQKEKRAQELHERCSSYLMSRKLEALAQQLVAMGFPHERAIMALILNEGKIEQSVVWLLEGYKDETSKQQPEFDNGNTLKLDISNELARMVEIETRCRCSRQDVERAIVSNEGDLEKAEESLKPEEPVILAIGKLHVNSMQNSMGVPQKGATTIIQKPRDVPTSEKLQLKTEWAKPQPVEKRWPVTASSSPISQAPSHVPVKPEARFVAVGDELKNRQSVGSIREPVMLMQRPQSTINGKMTPGTSISSSSLGTGLNWYKYNTENMKSNGLNWCPNDLYSQYSCQPASQPFMMSSNASMESVGINGFWNHHRTNASSSSPTIAAASSLGLFTGFGVNVTSGLDWNSGSSMAQFDYSNIDWSLDRDGGVMWVGGTNRNVPMMGGGGSQPWDGGGVRSSETSSATANNSREWSSPFEERDLFSFPRQFVSSPSL